MTPAFEPSGQFLVVNYHNIWLCEAFTKDNGEESLFVVDLAGRPSILYACFY